MRDDVNTIMEEIEDDMELEDDQRELIGIFKARVLRRIGLMFD